jgi:hypothetical protein
MYIITLEVEATENAGKENHKIIINLPKKDDTMQLDLPIRIGYPK